MNRQIHPVTPIPPTCSAHERGRCKLPSEVWLYAPDGLYCPGGWFCRYHADACITEYREKLGEIWTAEPLVLLCEHRRDPRQCPECRPHKFVPQGTPDEKHRPAAAGDYGCLRCGAWTTYAIGIEAANEKMGPCPEYRP